MPHPLTGLNDFDILGAAPIIRGEKRMCGQRKNKRAELKERTGTENKSRWHGVLVGLTYFYATEFVYIVSNE